MINADQRVRQVARRAGTPCLRYAGGAAAAAIILVFTAPAAAAGSPWTPEDPSRTPVVIEPVEVRVPVDDTIAEIVQMQLAAAAAAIVAAAVTKARLRRRWHRPAAYAVIDITDPRILDPPPDVAARGQDDASRPAGARGGWRVRREVSSGGR